MPQYETQSPPRRRQSEEARAEPRPSRRSHRLGDRQDLLARVSDYTETAMNRVANGPAAVELKDTEA